MKLEALFAVLDCTGSKRTYDNFRASLSEASLSLVRKAADHAGWHVDAPNPELSLSAAAAALLGPSVVQRKQKKRQFGAWALGRRIRPRLLSRAKAAADVAAAPAEMAEGTTDELPAAMPAAMPAAKKKKAKKNSLKKSLTEIIALPDNFGRNEPGRKLLRQELESIMELDTERFPTAPSFHKGLFQALSGKTL